MNSVILDRLATLRIAMKEEGIDAYIIPSSDHHLSEYTPVVWQARQWVSGFMGSAGTAVVTTTTAALWTDSRYFLEAGQVLEGTTFDLMKMGLPDTPSIAQYLLDNPDIKRVGFYGRSISATEAIDYINALKVRDIELVTSKDLVAQVQRNMLELPMNTFYVQPLEYAGRSITEKVANVRQYLNQNNADTLIITLMDEVAWLFNIRNNDVPFNPVGIAYALVTPDVVKLYTFDAKLDNEVREHLESQGVTIALYEEIYADIKDLSSDAIVAVDKARINYELYRSIPEACKQVNILSAVTALKAIKNESEYQGYRVAMRRDAVALTRFYIWLEQVLASGERPTEYEIGMVLAEFRAKGDKYVSDSFSPISGYRGNGAIVHYHADQETSAQLDRKGLFLLDSGGQYYDGTTDITRTIALDGNPTREEQEDYTLVLKGHIAIATAIFPEGTRGSQIDILARKALWDQGKNYGHGTGY